MPNNRLVSLPGEIVDTVYKLLVPYKNTCGDFLTATRRSFPPEIWTNK